MQSDHWSTPPEIPRGTLDPCPHNFKTDGLKRKWHGDVFCNPPYSEIDKWIDKALSERKNCKTITLLLPNWTDRKWFSKIQHCTIFYSSGRLKFNGSNGNKNLYTPRFGSMLIFIP